jgi:hypothetical protein
MTAAEAITNFLVIPENLCLGNAAELASFLRRLEQTVTGSSQSARLPALTLCAATFRPACIAPEHVHVVKHHDIRMSLGTHDCHLSPYEALLPASLAFVLCGAVGDDIYMPIRAPHVPLPIQRMSLISCRCVHYKPSRQDQKESGQKRAPQRISFHKQSFLQMCNNIFNRHRLSFKTAR